MDATAERRTCSTGRPNRSQNGCAGRGRFVTRGWFGFGFGFGCSSQSVFASACACGAGRGHAAHLEVEIAVGYEDAARDGLQRGVRAAARLRLLVLEQPLLQPRLVERHLVLARAHHGADGLRSQVVGEVGGGEELHEEGHERVERRVQRGEGVLLVARVRPVRARLPLRAERHDRRALHAEGLAGTRLRALADERLDARHAPQRDLEEWEVRGARLEDERRRADAQPPVHARDGVVRRGRCRRVVHLHARGGRVCAGRGQCGSAKRPGAQEGAAGPRCRKGSSPRARASAG